MQMLAALAALSAGLSAIVAIHARARLCTKAYGICLNAGRTVKTRRTGYQWVYAHWIVLKVMEEMNFEKIFGDYLLRHLR